MTARVRHRFLPAAPAGLLPWLVAALAFVAGLALAGALTLGDAANAVAANAADRATVQIVAADPAVRETQTRAALGLLARDPAASEVRLLPRGEVEGLLRPWLGPGVSAGELPLPAMIDVRLAGGTNTRALAIRLRAAAPAARLDRHGDWLGPAARTLRALAALSFAIVTLVAAATAAIVALAVRAALDGTRDTVELLHMMGAEDSGVAAIFERRAFALGGLGALGGAVCAALVLLFLAAGAVPWTGWLALALLPPALGLLAGVAARAGVRGALRALP